MRIQTQGKVVNPSFYKTIDCQMEQDLLFVEVVIKGKPYSFIYDTGAEVCVIDKEIVDQWPDVRRKSGKMTGSNRNTIKTEVITCPDMHIADVIFKDFKGFSVDLSPIKHFIGCAEVHGIIGNNVMRKASWQIDYEMKKITFTDLPNKLQFSDDVLTYKMDAPRYGNVYLPVAIASDTFWCIFDSGYTGFCRINDTSTLASNDYLTLAGITGSNIHSVIKGDYALMLPPSIAFPHATYEDKLVKVQHGVSNLLGNEYFKHYKVTVDWPNDLLYLDPALPLKNESLNRFPVHFRVNYSTNQLEVVQIVKGYGDVYEELIGNPVIQFNGKQVPQGEPDALCGFWEEQYNAIKEMNQFTAIVMKDDEKKLLTVHRISQY